MADETPPSAVPGILSDRALAEHMSYVGMVADAWAGLEYAIDYYSSKIGRVPQSVATCFTAQIMGAGRKLDTYIALVRLRNISKFNPELESFAKETTQLSEQRNRVIHDPWLITHNAIPSRLEATARRTLRLQYVEVPTAKVAALADRILDHTDRLIELHGRIMAAIGTSQ